jgi:hypothetical protein
MDSDTIITIISIIIGLPVIIIIGGVAVVVIAVAVLVVVSIGVVREVGRAIGAFVGRDFRVYDVKLVVVDPKVNPNEDSFFYFTWSIENDAHQAIQFQQELHIDEAAGATASGATSLAVLSSPLSATRAWAKSGTKHIVGVVTFTLADGSAVVASASGDVLVRG